MDPRPDAQQVALRALSQSVALWYVYQARASAVVFAACDLLVVGVDGPALRELAAIDISNSDNEVHTVLDAAIEELGLTLHPRDSEAAERAALAAISAHVLSSDIEPRVPDQLGPPAIRAPSAGPG